MSLFRTFFRDKRRLQSKFAIFPHPHVLMPRQKGSQLEWLGYRAEKDPLTISSAVWVQ